MQLRTKELQPTYNNSPFETASKGHTGRHTTNGRALKTPTATEITIKRTPTHEDPSKITNVLLSAYMCTVFSMMMSFHRGYILYVSSTCNRFRQCLI
jgi:hypothetical protein